MKRRPKPKPERCFNCGGLVLMPCKACQDYDDIASGRDKRRLTVADGDGLALELGEADQQRFSEH